MTPFKTEKEAWEFIATLYKTRSPKVFYKSPEFCNGICIILGSLYKQRMITSKQLNNMGEKINAEFIKKKVKSLYLYHETDFHSRALFAREQSKLCNFDFDIYFPSTWKVEWIISYLKERGYQTYILNLWDNKAIVQIAI